MPVLSLPVKPYVKQFLILNYSNPINLKKDKKLNNFFRACLTKPCYRYDKLRYAEISEYYSETVDITISDDDFYRYGWELSKTDTVRFGREIESNVKFFMKHIISFYTTHMELSKSVKKFQEKYGFTEDIWQYDSIIKDFQRNALKMKIDFSIEITEKIEKIVLVNLSEKKTISQLMLNTYAGNK
jgi:hypothetical protein